MILAVKPIGLWHMRRQNVLLSIWLILPILIIGLLIWAIALSLANPPRKMTPIGAGAGDTGGANAVGEALAGRSGPAEGQRADEKSPPPGNSEPPPTPAAQPDSARGSIQPESLPQGFVLVVEDKTGKARPDSPIFVAGSFNNWNPADEQYKLTPQSDMRWRILMPQPAGGTPIEFKFTRGSWELEELGSDMSAPGNRTLEPIGISTFVTGEQPKIELAVAHWGDERPEFADKMAMDSYRTIQATGNLRRLEVRGGAGAANSLTRELLVWLPPGYDEPENAAKTYPVLYLHDGQNVFEKLPAVPGEWRADETATTLIERNMMRPIIIVAIPHSGAGRIEEYLPFAAIDGATPRGSEHVQWLISDVLPRVQRAFRTAMGPENTAVGGSSLGAAISLYAATSHPDVFGVVLAESLPLRTGKVAAWDAYLNGVATWPGRIYLGMGGSETGVGAERSERNQGYVDAARALEKRLSDAGLHADRRLLLVDDDAGHNEDAWAERLPAALRFLFPVAPDSK